MKKYILIIAFVFISIQVHAAGPCGDFDYTELKDMDQKTLLKTYCESLDDTRTYMKASMYNRSRAAEEDFNSCAAVTNKIERVYMKRFGIEDRQEMMKLCK